MPHKDKQEEKTYQHQYYLKHKKKLIKKSLAWERGEKGKRYHSKYYEKRKLEVFTHYSKGNIACKICGFNDVRALSIDHIDGDGANHRRTLDLTAGFQFYLWLIKQGFPEGYQVLCMNCQTIKRRVNNENKRRGK